MGALFQLNPILGASNPYWVRGRMAFNCFQLFIQFGEYKTEKNRLISFA